MKFTELPERIYHGTNIVAAVRILNCGRIEATTPVDGSEPVVCTTALRAIARCFAVEFERANSSHEVGVIFAINSRNFGKHVGVESIDAESASFDEREFRVADDIGIGHVIGVQCVGTTNKLKSRRYLEELHGEHCRDIQWSRFSDIVANLAARQIGPLMPIEKSGARP